jgi:hypothetical protein
MSANAVHRHLHTLHCSDASASCRLQAAEGVISSMKLGISVQLEDTPEHHALARSVITYALTNLSKASAALKVLPDPSCVSQETLPFALKSRPWIILETILVASPNAVLLSAMQGVEWSLIKPASHLLQYCSSLLGQEPLIPHALERVAIINTCLQRLLSCLKSTCMPEVPSAARLLNCACSLLTHSSTLAILKCIELCARTFELSCRRTLHSKRAFAIACEEVLLPCSAVLRSVQFITVDTAALVSTSIKAALHAALFSACPASNFLSALLKFQSPAESQSTSSKKRKLSVDNSTQHIVGTPETKGAAAAGDAYQGLLFKVLSDGLQDASLPDTIISSCVGVAAVYDLFAQQVSSEYGSLQSAVNPQQLVDVLACRSLCSSLVAVLNQRTCPLTFNIAASAAGSVFQSASKHRLYRAFPPHSLDGYAQCMGLVLAAAKQRMSDLDRSRDFFPGVFEFLQGVIEMDVTLLLAELPWLLLLCSAALHQESPLPVASGASSILRSMCSCCSSLYRFDELMQASCRILIDHPVQRLHSVNDDWSNCIAACMASTRDEEVISKSICSLCDLIATQSTPDAAATSLCMFLQRIVCESNNIRTSCLIDDCSSNILAAVKALFARGGKTFVKSLSSGLATDEQQLCVSSAMQLLAHSVTARVGLHSLFPAGGSNVLLPFIENPFSVDFSDLSRFVSASCNPAKSSGIISHLIFASVAIQCAAASVADVLCRLPPGVAPPTESVTLFAKSSGLANSALSIASHIRNCKFRTLHEHFRDASVNGELERGVWQLIQDCLRSLCDFCSDSSLTHIWTEILSHVSGGHISTHVQRLLCDPYFYDISSLRAASIIAVQQFVQQQRSSGKNWPDDCKPDEISHVCSFISSLPPDYIDDSSVHALIVLCLDLASHYFVPFNFAAATGKKKSKSNQAATASMHMCSSVSGESSASLICAAASLAHACPASARFGAANRTFHDFFSSALTFICSDQSLQSSELVVACCCLLQRLSSAAVHHCNLSGPNKDITLFFDFFIDLLNASSSSICSKFALSILQGVDCNTTSDALPPSFHALAPLSERHLLVAWSQNQSVTYLRQIAQCLAIRRRLQVSHGSDSLISSLPLFLAYCVETCSQQQRPSVDHASNVAIFLAEYVQILPALEPQPCSAILLAIFGIATVLENDHPSLGVQIISSMLSCGIHSTSTTLLKAAMSLLNPSRIPFDEEFASSCSRIFPVIYCGPRWQQRLRTLEKSVDAVICLCGGAAVSCCSSRKFDCASTFMTSLSSVLAGTQSLAVPLSALRCALDCSLAVFQQLCAPAQSDSNSSYQSNLSLSSCSWM